MDFFHWLATGETGWIAVSVLGGLGLLLALLLGRALFVLVHRGARRR